MACSRGVKLVGTEDDGLSARIRLLALDECISPSAASLVNEGASQPCLSAELR